MREREKRERMRERESLVSFTPCWYFIESHHGVNNDEADEALSSCLGNQRELENYRSQIALLSWG